LFAGGYFVVRNFFSFFLFFLASALPPEVAWGNEVKKCEWLKDVFHCDGGKGNYSRDENSRRCFCDGGCAGKTSLEDLEKKKRFQPPEKAAEIVGKIKHNCTQSYWDHQKKACNHYKSGKCASVLAKAQKEDLKEACKKGGAKGCQEKANEEQRKSAQEIENERKSYQGAIADAEDLMTLGLSAAADYMDGWANSLATSPTPDPNEKRIYQHDEKLFERAISTFQDTKSPFSLEDAASAQDEGLSKLLTFAVNSREVKSIEEEGDRDLASAQEALQGMVVKTGQRAADLSSNVPGIGTDAKKSSISGKSEEGLVSGETAKIDAEKSDIAVEEPQSLKEKEARKLEKLNLKSSGSERPGSGSDPYFASPKAGLRDNLRRRLIQEESQVDPASAKAKGVDKDALDGTSFGKGLGGVGLVAGDEGKAGSSVISDESLTLASSEAAAEIHRLAGSSAAGRDLASSEFSGLLGVDSQNLFERVRHAHRACLEKRCL